MPEINVEFEVFCSCGATLDAMVSTYNRHISIEIEPCEKCLDKARGEGYDKGVSETEDRNADK